MAEENWLPSSSGALIVPPSAPREIHSTYFVRERERIMEEVRQEFDGAIGNLQEQIGPQGNAQALGLSGFGDEVFGDGGFWGRGGPQEEVLRLLAERLTQISGRLYGGMFGFGYGGQTESELGDIIRQLAALMWVFPEYNPMIKQMVDIRPLYVFGQGFDVVGESKRKKRQQMRKIHERRLELQMQAQANMAAMNGAGMDSDGMGGDLLNPSNSSPSQNGNGSGPGYSPGGMARDAANQRSSRPGRAQSTPGPRAGRNNPRR